MSTGYSQGVGEAFGPSCCTNPQGVYTKRGQQALTCSFGISSSYVTKQYLAEVKNRSVFVLYDLLK